MSIARSTEPVLRPPANLVSPRAVRYWFARAATAWVILLGVQVVSWRLDWSLPPWHVPLLVVSAVIAVAHVAVMPRWRYRVHRWELTDEAVYTQAGWFAQERRIAPLSRIQTVDTERGPIGRLFGLAKVTVTTASAAGPVVIDGLELDEAARIAVRLTEAAQASAGDAT
jgi:membrane protein YdbS with pleckstrin-like domain